jgi:hypothetical protein
MSAFEDLQRQLLESVAERRAQGATSEPARSSRSRVRWAHSGARRRRLLALIAIPLAFAAAAAAAKLVTQSRESPENVLLNRVLGATGSSAACRMTGPRRSRLSGEAPESRITATLPALARAPREAPPAAVVALAERNSGGAVLARTIRVVRLPDGLSLIEYVAYGEGPFTLLDPRLCEHARLALLARLRPAPHDPLREAVARQIRQMSDTNSAIQSLTLDRREQRAGAPLDGGGASFPVLATYKRLPTGVLFSGSGCEYARPGHPAHCSPDFYGGIVGRATAYLTLEAAGGARRNVRPHEAARRIAVNEGLFLFAVPRGVGPEVVVQRARDGRALTRERLR